jgi:hypothetical protein
MHGHMNVKYASYVGGCLPTLQYRLLVPYSSVLDSLTIEDETVRLPLNFRNKLPMHAV